MRWALPVIALIAACAGASDQEKPSRPPAKPALWLLADEDTEIYLFGTIHVLPDNFVWRTPVFDNAARRSQELVVEVADVADESKTTDIFLDLAVSTDLPPVSERVPPDRRAGLEALRVKAGVPETVLDRFETWAVAITLAAGVLKTLDISPANGVEKQLQAEFGARKRPISGLETTEYQLSLFDHLPEATQRAFLVNMVDESTDARTEFERMISAWGRGDEAAIALTFDDEVALTPELTEALLKRRNAAWAEWLKRRLEKPGIVMLAVGAGHLAGPYSVQSLLSKDGLRVTRLQ